MDRTPSEAAPDGFRSIRTQLRWTTGISVVVLLLTCLGAAWLVVWPRSVIGSDMRTVSVPALASLLTERQLSMAYLARPANGSAALRAQQDRTDAGLRASALPAFTRDLAQLGQERASILARTTNATQVYTFYDNLLDAATNLFDSQARSVPDAGITQSAIAAVALFRDADDMSRAGSLVGDALAAGTFTSRDYLEFQRLAGSYHSDLAVTVRSVRPDVRDQYAAIVAGTAFRRLTNAENAVLERGSRAQPAPRPFPVGPVEWANLTTSVSGQLVDLAIRQANDVATETADVGRDQFRTGLAVLIAVVLAAVGAVLATFRLSGRLAVRLQRVADDVAGERAPDMVRRIDDGEDVDVAAEVPLLDDGRDEIGFLARRLRAAWIADLTARKREILSRKGLTLVLVALAMRIQEPLTRLVGILDDAQQEETDPELLDVLYSLDHETARAGRQVDNLVVLAGESLSRRWTRPVPLIDVVRRAVSETADYRRFALGQFPDYTSVPPDTAPHLAHLISELLDNAANNSRADSMVNVRAVLTGRGVAVEVEDMGRGLTPDELDQLNARMADPPEFDTMAAEPATRQLGTFVVARLAAKLGVHVGYRESTYRGVLAVVVIPASALPTVRLSDWPHDDADGNDLVAAATADTETFPTTELPSGTPLPKRRRGASLAASLRSEAESR